MKANVNTKMDQRIVALNVYKTLKLSSFSVGKRQKIKDEKEIAKYILENWDDVAKLDLIKGTDYNKELMHIINSRRSELRPVIASNAKAKKIERKVGDVHKNGIWEWREYSPGKFDWRTIKK